MTLPAKLKAGTYTFTINGAGQVARDYALVREPTKARAGNVRATFPSNAITIRVEEKCREPDAQSKGERDVSQPSRSPLLWRVASRHRLRLPAIRN